MKYKEWLDEWLEFFVKPSTKERTYNKYRQQIGQYIIPVLGNHELRELTATKLQRFIATLSQHGLSANTVNGIISVLKNSLCRAVSLGVANKQFTDGIARLRVREKQIDCFTMEEQRIIEQYILTSTKRKLFGIILCLYTGLRIGELLSLTWSDFDLMKGVMVVSKSCHDGWKNGKYVKVIDTPKTENSYRIVPIPKQLLPRLKELKKKENKNYVISGKTEYGAEVRSYQRTFEKMLVNLSISHKGFHSLRHTFATRALEVGMDVKTLSEILGHSNPTVTLKRYTHSLIEHKTEMMNRVGKLLL